MVDRLRALLDHPLDPSAARAVLVLASAIFLGLAALFILATGQADHSPVGKEKRPASTAPPPASANSIDSPSEGQRIAPRSPAHRQDPQDVPGSAAARRAARALRSHRALQHVPYRSGEIRVDLVGARGNRAVLRISAPTLADARRGWRLFLARHRDSGKAYVLVFKASGGDDG
jgi:hypothetical protein